MRPRPTIPALLLLAGALTTCSGEGAASREPRWIELARGHRPRPLGEVALQLEEALDPPRQGAIVSDPIVPDELWFELTLPPGAWTPGAQDGDWNAELPRGGAMLAMDPGSIVLQHRGDDLRTWRQTTRREIVQGRAPDGLLLERGVLTLVTGATPPPEGLVVRGRLDHGREVDGAWRCAQGDLACNGFLVFPGAPEHVEVEVPPASILTFATVSPDPDGRGEDLGPTRFRVTVDGAILLDEEQELVRPVRSRTRSLSLPAGRHAIGFEVIGPAPAVIASPVIGPADVGRPGARPWGATRPDVVLLLLDTYRADNLAAWGGDPELSPALNAFVERSVRFLDARATAAWTLPSIGSIMSGVFPGQHGGTDLDVALVDSVRTQAEVLSEAGYRTVAVTDAGLFSRLYGQDQGFEWFEEVPVTRWNLPSTLARTRRRMAADDGRPLFLVVHTYRVHGPMRVGPEEDGRPWQEFLAQVRAERLERQRQGLPKAQGNGEFIEVGRQYYHDAVRDLDAKVGPWIEELEADGFFRHGYLALTADHGNAYGENGESGHGGELYDSKLRVPLALRGPGLAPRSVEGVVSLVDLPPTLIELAGCEPPPSWPGRSLLGALPPRPSYAFDLKKNHREIALFAEGRKLMAEDVDALRAGTPTHAFDLAVDPGEENDLAGSMQWPGELGKALAPGVEPLLEPAAGARSIELSAEMQQQLQAIGYTE